MLACLLDVAALLLPARLRHAVRARLALACYAANLPIAAEEVMRV